MTACLEYTSVWAQVMRFETSLRTPIIAILRKEEDILLNCVETERRKYFERRLAELQFKLGRGQTSNIKI
jgi:hypothetical protein